MLVPTGIAIAIPRGHAGFVLPRSGLALHHGVTCLNTPGLVDCGYRGELKVVLVNTDPTTDYQVHRGDRIAQLVVGDEGGDLDYGARVGVQTGHLQVHPHEHGP